MKEIFPLINVGLFPRKVTMNDFTKNMLIINNCLASITDGNKLGLSWAKLRYILIFS